MFSQHMLKSSVVLAMIVACATLAAGQRKRGGNAEEEYNQGIRYASQGQLPQAIEAYKQAIRLRPKFAEPYNNLGNLYGKLGQYQQAMEAYHQAIRIKPDLAEAYHNLGATYTKLGRYQEAVEASRQ